MNILLLGEYSNVHATLAKGLRQLGHEVTVASNGDFWKDYPRDIDLARTPGKMGGIRLMGRVARLLPRWRNYDVVQLINPMFLELKASRIRPVYDYLRRHNRRIVLGAFGMDYYWVNTCSTDSPFRYSDFNIGNAQRQDEEALRQRKDWLGTAKERLNRHVAATADAIVAGLYEYYLCYRPSWEDKTTFIPLPIEEDTLPQTTITQHPTPDAQPPLSGICNPRPPHTRLKVFIGIQRGREAYKGSDVMLRVAQQLAEKYPDRMELVQAVSVPFEQYSRMMDSCDVLLDQLYSYTPSMNTLLAMQKGIVCIGGGEEEALRFMGEEQLRPVINVEPTAESVRQALEHLILHPDVVAQKKQESRDFVHRHHNHLHVARQYERLYQQILTT